jgi:hypothetical protein
MKKKTVMRNITSVNLSIHTTAYTHTAGVRGIWTLTLTKYNFKFMLEYRGPFRENYEIGLQSEEKMTANGAHN